MNCEHLKSACALKVLGVLPGYILTSSFKHRFRLGICCCPHGTRYTQARLNNCLPVHILCSHPNVHDQLCSFCSDEYQLACRFIVLTVVHGDNPVIRLARSYFEVLHRTSMTTNSMTTSIIVTDHLSPLLQAGPGPFSLPVTDKEGEAGG